jgi:hypothetical protein
MSARTDLCGGRSAMIVPTATSFTSEDSSCLYSRLVGQMTWRAYSRVTGKPHLTGSLPIQIGSEGLADGLLTSYAWACGPPIGMPTNHP